MSGFMEANGGGMSRAAKKRRRKREERTGVGAGAGGKEEGGCEVEEEEVEMRKENSYDSSSFTGDDNSREKKRPALAATLGQVDRKMLKSIDGFEMFAAPLDENDVVCGEDSLKEVLEKRDSADYNASDRAACLLSILLRPLSRKDFYGKCWQKECWHSNRDESINFKGIYSNKLLNKILSKHMWDCSTEILLGRFTSSGQEYYHRAKGGESESMKLSAKEITAANEFAYQLVYPQKVFDGIWMVMSGLEFEFGNALRASLLVSPPGVQGFAPSLNSGDTFIVQLEGTVTIKAYSSNNDSNNDEYEWPPSIDEFGVIVDSSSFHSNVKPVEIMNLIAGNTAYIPKGWFVEISSHSSSQQTVTLQMSTNHHHGALDLVEVLLPEAMEAVKMWGPQKSIGSNIACRSLPQSFLDFMGVSRSENDDDKRRDELKSFISSTMSVVMEKALDMLDPAADQMAKNFISSRLPVPTSREEESKLYSQENASVYPYSKLRMLRPGIARAVIEDGVIVVYHCMDNSRVLHEATLNPLEFELDDGPAIEVLLDAYPNAVMVLDLPHPSEELEDKVSIAQALFKEGFLMIDEDSSKNDSDGESDSCPF